MSELIYSMDKRLKEIEAKQKDLESKLDNIKLSLNEARKQNIEIAKKTGATVTDTGV